MFKRLLALIPIFLILILPKSVLAFKAETFVTIANPVRGYESWTGGSQSPLDLPKFQYQESTPSAFPVTWLLRFDAVNSATISGYFQGLLENDQNQSLGAFLEVTPLLAFNARVDYPKGLTFFSANHIFLSGYTQEDRLKLIDAYMNAFFTRFGYYPRSVAAWHIDSYSLQYLQSKYSVLTAMNCDDQYSTDNYRIWGGYLGSPYFPDKNNSLIPASSLTNRVNLAMVRWAQRDLFNFYGYRSESSYSVQVNDYLAQGQTTKYFDNLLALYSQRDLNEFTYVNIGLENDYSLSQYRKEIVNVYHSLKANEEKDNLHFISLANFGDWMKVRYPESSPTYFYRTGDPTGTNKGEVFWYQGSHYRIGLRSENGRTKIIDFRVYNRQIYEDYFATPNQSTNLSIEIPAAIDSVKSPGTELTIDTDLSKYKTTYDKQWDLWQMTLVNGNQKIIFYPASIQFTNISVPALKAPNVKVSQKGAVITWDTKPFMPFKDTYNYSWVFWTILAIVLFILIKKLIKRGWSKTPLFLIIGTIAVLLAGLASFKNGFDLPFGLGYFGPNGHDAIFHLSLIQKFAQSPFDLSHPQLAGAKLTNYHFIFDYLSGIISGIFNIPPSTLYFTYIPLLFGVILVCLLGKLMEKWHYSPMEKALGFILAFLAGSFGFIPRTFVGDIFAGESTFWSNQSASLFLNPPYVLSLIFLLWFLLILPSAGKMRPMRFLGLVILGAILAQTKVYVFILLGIALLFNRHFKLAVAIGIVGGLISLPFTSLAGSPFVFNPFWFPRSLFASYDRLYWEKFVQAWQSYEASGNFLKLIAVNLFATAVFYVGNLGLRVLGIFGLSKEKPVDLSQKIVNGIIIVGLVLPILFIQNINPWNTIQFMYYSLFFLGLATAKVIARLALSIKNTLLRVCFLIAIMVIATLTSVGTLRDYFGSRSPSRVSYTEMFALQTLKEAPRGIVLSPLFKNADWLATPKPLYAYVSTAYISAFSGQQEFLSDTINLDITGYNYQTRARDILRFYNTEDIGWAKNFLEKNKIRYIYTTPVQKMTLTPGNLHITQIFDSGEINIYKIY